MIGFLRIAAAEPEVVDIESLYRAYARKVERWAARLGGPGIDVEDIVQEVFMVAKRRLRTYGEEAQLNAWLFRTTDKVVRTARRKQRVRGLLRGAFADVVDFTSGGRPGPVERLESEEATRHVYRVLDRLSEKQRRVLILFEIEGMSTQELADLFGIRLGTVRVWLYRARAAFAAASQAEMARTNGSHVEQGEGGRA